MYDIFFNIRCKFLAYGSLRGFLVIGCTHQFPITGNDLFTLEYHHHCRSGAHKIGQAFSAKLRTVLLIDEIDKADTDFQDDMLDVLDQMEFDIIEIDKTIKAIHRPVIIITSNAKKDLSDPFLGRCNFHHIAFPEPEMMHKIILVHFPQIDTQLLENAITAFYAIRDFSDIEKRPATRELINWIRALKADPDFKPKQLEKGDLPYLGVLFKKSEDLHKAQSMIGRRRAY
mgnify:CR=1 FL=1